MQSAKANIGQQEIAALSDFVVQLARALVDDSDAVHVNANPGDRTLVLELKVAKGDVGKILGKQGRTVLAIRTLLGAVSTKLGQRVILEVLD